MTDQRDAQQEKDDAESEPLSPFIKAYIDKTIQESYKAKDKTRNKKWKNAWRSAAPITKVTFYCAAVVAICTLCACLISVFQLNRMIDQNKIMQGNLDEQKRSGEQSTDQVWKAIGNINWMARSADWNQKAAQNGIESSNKNADSSVRAMIGNFHKEQRAWVGADVVETMPGPRLTDHQLSVVFANTGLTPAHGAHVVTGYFMRGLIKEPNQADANWIEKVIGQVESGEISPGDILQSHIAVGPDVPANLVDSSKAFNAQTERELESKPMGDGRKIRFVLPDELFGKMGAMEAPGKYTLGVIAPKSPFRLPIASGPNWMGATSSMIVVYGKTTYVDEFQQSRITTFCQYSLRADHPEWRICSVYNDMN